LKRETSELLSRRAPPVLMWILVGVIMASPLADAHPRIGAFVALVVLLCVLTGASFARNKRNAVLVGIPLAGIWFAIRMMGEFGGARYPYDHAAHFVGIALSCTILWALLGRLQTTQKVTSSVIAEAAIVYLTIAIAFAQLYWILGESVADCFRPPIANSSGTTYLYFSLVTITGVGYGGIVPVNPYVRLIAAFENMTGLFYIAIVVAKLVSSYRVPFEIRDSGYAENDEQST
jgi:hypothetical protein